jgi:hypothetical protein
MQSTFTRFAFGMSLMYTVIFCVFFATNAVGAQNEPAVIMHTLTVEVEHESGKDITVHVGQAGEINEFVFTLEQAIEPQFIESELSELEPAVLEAVKGALLRINRSEVLVNSKRVDEVAVEWVTELCNDTNADCESIIALSKDDKLQ